MAKKTGLVLLSVALFMLISSEVRCAPTEMKHEFNPFVSLYKGDTMRNFFLGGLNYTFHINRRWWVGTSFMGGRTRIDATNGTAVVSGDNYFAVDAAAYFNLPAILGAAKAGDAGRFADLYFFIGGGYMWLGAANHPYGAIGGGLAMYPGPSWLAIRVEIKNMMYGLNNTNGSDFNNDLAFNVGPSFLF